MSEENLNGEVIEEYKLQIELILIHNLEDHEQILTFAIENAVLLTSTDHYITFSLFVLRNEMFFFPHLFIATRARVPSEAHATNITIKP